MERAEKANNVQRNCPRPTGDNDTTRIEEQTEHLARDLRGRERERRRRRRSRSSGSSGSSSSSRGEKKRQRRKTVSRLQLELCSAQLHMLHQRRTKAHAQRPSLHLVPRNVDLVRPLSGSCSDPRSALRSNSRRAPTPVHLSVAARAPTRCAYSLSTRLSQRAHQSLARWFFGSARAERWC